MDASEALEPTDPKPVFAQVRDRDTLVIPNDYKSHPPFSGYEHCNLSFDVVRNGRDLASYLMRNNLTAGYSAAVQILQSSLLAGLKTTGFAVYLLYRKCPLCDSDVLNSHLVIGL